MQELSQHIDSLNTRRMLAIYIVLVFAIIALIFEYNFQISSPTYFNGEYNLIFANGLIIYKLIELLILYYILFHRYLIKLKSNTYNTIDFSKLKKHTKLLYFLIPQGNTIFGMIAYKLSANVLYFFLFSFIALVTLILVKPRTLKMDD